MGIWKPKSTRTSPKSLSSPLQGGGMDSGDSLLVSRVHQLWFVKIEKEARSSPPADSDLEYLVMSGGW